MLRPVMYLRQFTIASSVKYFSESVIERTPHIQLNELRQRR
jgi:hypothetical protein